MQNASVVPMARPWRVRSDRAGAEAGELDDDLEQAGVIVDVGHVADAVPDLPQHGEEVAGRQFCGDGVAVDGDGFAH